MESQKEQNILSSIQEVNAKAQICKHCPLSF